MKQAIYHFLIHAFLWATYYDGCSATLLRCLREMIKMALPVQRCTKQYLTIKYTKWYKIMLAHFKAITLKIGIRKKNTYIPNNLQKIAIIP